MTSSSKKSEKASRPTDSLSVSKNREMRTSAYLSDSRKAGAPEDEVAWLRYQIRWHFWDRDPSRTSQMPQLHPVSCRYSRTQGLRNTFYEVADEFVSQTHTQLQSYIPLLHR
jgi:hypothetical protein